MLPTSREEHLSDARSALTFCISGNKDVIKAAKSNMIENGSNTVTFIASPSALARYDFKEYCIRMICYKELMC